MTQLGEFGYTVVDLDEVIAHYVDDEPASRSARC